MLFNQQLYLSFSIFAIMDKIFFRKFGANPSHNKFVLHNWNKWIFNLAFLYNWHLTGAFVLQNCSSYFSPWLDLKIIPFAENVNWLVGQKMAENAGFCLISCTLVFWLFSEGARMFVYQFCWRQPQVLFTLGAAMAAHVACN